MNEDVSANLIASLDRSNPEYKATIELYRQLWVGGVYVYDTAIDITDYLTEDSAGTIMWKLDKEDYGVFTLDNVTLTFRNDRNQWRQGNPKGLFPAGSLINQSKIIVRIGAKLADGTYEVVRSFTGYIASDPDVDPETKSVSMTLVSRMEIFEKKSAEDISNPVPDEEHAYTAPGIFAYDTVNVGVAAVKLVVKRGLTADGAAGATEIKPTTGYEISNQNKKDLPLTVTLVTALTATESIWITYIYWHQDKLLGWLAEQVMTLCGVTSYAISPAVFSGNAEVIWDFNSQAEWDTCTKTNIDTITAPGSFKLGVLDDFKDGDYTAAPAWEVRNLKSGSSIAVVSGNLQFTTSNTDATSNVLKLASTRALGSWQFRAWTQTVPQSTIHVWIMGDTETVGGVNNGVPQAGYFLDCSVYYGLTLKRADGTILINATALTIISTDVIRVSRTAGGHFELFVNEVSYGTATDNTYTTSAGIYLRTAGYSGGFGVTTYQFFNDLHFWADGTTPGSAVMESPIKDCGASVKSYGTLAVTDTVNGATIAIETYSSGSADFSTDNDPAGWVAISGTGLILSLVKRYLKFRVTGTVASMVYPLLSPVFDQITVKYYTDATTIDLVDLTGLSCRQVLDLVAEMPAFELGFKSNDTFIYRPRTTGVGPILDLRSDTNIKLVRNLVDGVDRVKNRIVAEFGIYRVIADASADAAPNSMTKYDTREYPVSASNLLPAENVNLAYAVAPTILAYTKNPRRRCTIETKFILHLELGDKVTVYYDEPTALRQWHYDDTDVAYDQPDLEYYEDEDVPLRLNLWGVVMRVEGVEFDFQNWTTSFDLVEVI